MLEKLSASMWFHNGRVTVLHHCVQFIRNLSLLPPAVPNRTHMSWVQLADKAPLCCNCSGWGGRHSGVAQPLGGVALSPRGPAPKAGGLMCVHLGAYPQTPKRREKIWTIRSKNFRIGMCFVPFLRALSKNAEPSRTESRMAYGLELSLCVSRLHIPGPVT